MTIAVHRTSGNSHALWPRLTHNPMTLCGLRLAGHPHLMLADGDRRMDVTCRVCARRVARGIGGAR